MNDAGKYDDARVREIARSASFHVRGRVIALRGTGGLTFIRLRDRTGELQLLISEAEMGAEYTHLEDIDIGDFVQAEGALTASKRGELSLETKVLRLVTKALRPLPEKWARAHRRGDALPPALRGPGRQSRRGRGVSVRARTWCGRCGA